MSVNAPFCPEENEMMGPGILGVMKEDSVRICRLSVAKSLVESPERHVK